MKKLFVILVMLSAISVNAQWEPDVRLTNATGSSFTHSNWCIAANGNVVHTVWYDERDGNWEIYYKRSTDGGINWGSDTRLTNNTAYSVNPSITVSGSLVHLVWTDGIDGNLEIYYKRSTDGGINWSSDTRLTNAAAVSEYPSIAVSGSFVHVVWLDERDGNPEIYYKHTADEGVTWGADIRLTNNTSVSWYPSIAVSGSNVNVVWWDNRDGNFEIYYKHSTDSGINWVADTRLTNYIANSHYSSIAVSGLVVHVVWEDWGDGNAEIYYKRSTDGGINWSSDTRLTNAAAVSEYPSIAVSGSFVHVVWLDERDGNAEIYYKRSIDAGTTWGQDIRLTSNSAYSKFPSISVSGSLVHVVWNDNRDGNYEVFYKRNPTGNLVDIQNISTETPSSYSLKQNYPNPFNPRTVIRFDIQKPEVRSHNSVVTLKIYDVTGREVQTLVNERLQPGTYEATFDGSALNSGVYFYKLMTEGFTETKRMMLIK